MAMSINKNPIFSFQKSKHRNPENITQPNTRENLIKIINEK